MLTCSCYILACSSFPLTRSPIHASLLSLHHAPHNYSCNAIYFLAYLLENFNSLHVPQFPNRAYSNALSCALHRCIYRKHFSIGSSGIVKYHKDPITYLGQLIVRVHAKCAKCNIVLGKLYINHHLVISSSLLHINFSASLNSMPTHTAPVSEQASDNNCSPLTNKKFSETRCRRRHHSVHNFTTSKAALLPHKCCS